MRSLLLATLPTLLLLVAAACPVQAQAVSTAMAAPVQVLDDSAGDLALGSPAPIPLAVPAEVYGPLDLRGLSLSDDDENVTFTLAVGQVHTWEDPDGRAYYDVRFNHGELPYLVRFRQASDLGVYYDAYLYRILDDKTERWMAWSALTADEEAATLQATFPKARLVDHRDAMPTPASQLTGFSVVARSMQAGGGTLQNYDRMPDQGEGATAYRFQSGLVQNGLELWSQQPFRVSNGEATTYVFDVQATNHGAAGRFELSAEGVPSNWDIQFPLPVLGLAAGETRAAPVLATVPFAHIHGTQTTFVVRLQPADGDSTGRLGQIRLGVQYTDPARPSGHHPTLYVHGNEYDNGPGFTEAYQVLRSGGNGGVWMDTDADNEQAVDPVAGWYYQAGSNRIGYSWWPSVYDLGTGLDFDLGRPFHVSVPIHTPLPLPDAELRVQVSYAYREAGGPWQSTQLMQVVSERVSLDADSTYTFELETLPLPDADYLPAQRESVLEMGLLLTAGRPGADQGGQAPKLMPGAVLDLPLLEYHDPVDEVFAAIDGVRLHAEGPSERDVNPGETVLFNLALQNGADAGDFHIGLRGEHAAWARVLGGDRIDMQDGGRERFTVAVTAPADAADGQSLDLLVEAHGPGGATALLRLAGQVVTGTDVPDEAHLVAGLDAERDSPAPTVAWLALAVLALAVALRRRVA